MRLSLLSKYIVLFCMGLCCTAVYSMHTQNYDTFDNLVGFTPADMYNDQKTIDGYDYCLCGITGTVTCVALSAKAFLSPGLWVLLPFGSLVFHAGYRAALYLTHAQASTDPRSHTIYHELDSHSNSDEEIEEYR